MKRLLASLISFCFLIIAGALFFHWSEFTTEGKPNSQDIEATQQFHIIHKGNQFHIEHRVLSDGAVSTNSLPIVLPNGAKDIKCTVQSTQQDCLTKENGQFLVTFSKGQKEPMNFSIYYTLEKTSNVNSLLLEEWYSAVENMMVSSTSIQITDYTFRSGQWFSGLKAQGSKRLEIIDYYSFKGSGGPTSLYWQKEPLKKHSIEGIDLYSNSNATSSIDMPEHIKGHLHITIIHTNLTTPYQSDRLMITDNMQSVNELQKQLVWSFTKQSYSFPADQIWLGEIVANSLTELQKGSERSIRMYEDIIQSLTETQMNKWKTLLTENQDAGMNAKMLDNWLGESTGYVTTFFQDNVADRPAIAQLMFQVPKPVYVNEKQMDAKMIVHQEKMLLPFKSTLQSLGYDMNELEDKAILVTRDGNTYRFYSDQEYFIYNEENYGLLSKPVITINGESYIDQYWLEKLFNITVEKSESKISISSPPNI